MMSSTADGSSAVRQKSNSNSGEKKNDDDADYAMFLAKYCGVLDDDKLHLLWHRVIDFYADTDRDFRIRKAGEFIQEMFECGDTQSNSCGGKSDPKASVSSSSSSAKNNSDSGSLSSVIYANHRPAYPIVQQQRTAERRSGATRRAVPRVQHLYSAPAPRSHRQHPPTAATSTDTSRAAITSTKSVTTAAISTDATSTGSTSAVTTIAPTRAPGFSFPAAVKAPSQEDEEVIGIPDFAVTTTTSTAAVVPPLSIDMPLLAAAAAAAAADSSPNTGQQQQHLRYFLQLFKDQMSQSDLLEVWNSLSEELSGSDRTMEAALEVMNLLDSSFHTWRSVGSTTASSSESEPDTIDADADATDYVDAAEAIDADAAGSVVADATTDVAVDAIDVAIDAIDVAIGAIDVAADSTEVSVSEEFVMVDSSPPPLPHDYSDADDDVDSNDEDVNGDRRNGDNGDDEFLVAAPSPPPPPPNTAAFSSSKSIAAATAATYDAATVAAMDFDEYVLLNSAEAVDDFALVWRLLEEEDARIARQLMAEEEAASLEHGSLHEQRSLRLAKKLQKAELARRTDCSSSNSNNSSSGSRSLKGTKLRLHQLRGMQLPSWEVNQMSPEQLEKFQTVKLCLQDQLPVSDDSIYSCLSQLHFNIDEAVLFLVKKHADRSYAGRLSTLQQLQHVRERDAAAEREAAMQPEQNILFTPVGKTRKGFSNNSNSTNVAGSGQATRLQNYLKYCVLQTMRKHNPDIVFNLDSEGHYQFRGFKQQSNCSVGKRGVLGKLLIYPLELRYQLGSEHVHASVDLHGLFVQPALEVVDQVLHYYLYGAGVRIVAEVAADAATAVAIANGFSLANTSFLSPLRAHSISARYTRNKPLQSGVFVLQLIVGKGLHSAGKKARISPAVQKHLRSEWEIDDFRVDEGRVLVPLRSNEK